MEPRVISLWLFPKSSDASFKAINTKEREWAEGLTERKAKEYLHARTQARAVLSTLFNKPPLNIPLHAPPGLPPVLEEGYGFISISHCKDALAIGWSDNRLGIDIECSDRSFAYEKIAARFFNKTEQSFFASLEGEELRLAVLNAWIQKEAAIKWQRGSISNDFSAWEFTKGSQQGVHKSLGYQVESKQITIENWILAIASENKSIINLITNNQNFMMNNF